MSDRFRLSIVVTLVLAVAACAGRGWEQARTDDTVAAYHRFLREHADSKYAPEARARLAAARIRHKPSRKAFEGFRRRFPDSALIDELRPYVEEHFFTATRMQGTAAGYRAFLADFPDGAFAARAVGNADYLEHRGYGGRLADLGDFAARHPESDYSAEAQRSVAAAAFRSESSFRTVALVVEIDQDAPGADRLERVFTQRAVAAYRAAGLSLVPTSGAGDASIARSRAQLRIGHEEREVQTQLRSGTVAQPGILARTTVRVIQAGEVIWEDHFEHRASLSERKSGVSILFGVGTAEYWGTFFVPVATWNTQRAARAPRVFSKAPVDVETTGSRAVVLFGDGDFQVFDLGDPASPALLTEYRRERDLSTFSGVTVANQQVVAYGPDGIEVVRIAGGPVERTAVFGREDVGSIVGVETVGGTLVAASNRGLLRYGSDRKFRALVPNAILGLARLGDRVLFTDGKSLYVSTLKLLETGRVEGELRIGRGFGPEHIRVSGTSAVVLGERGVLWVDLSRPSQPRIVSRIGTTEAGEIEDAVVLGGRLFLLGTRGLQISDRTGERIVDSVDVRTRARLGRSGRHIVMIGGDSLQVVDATPFFASAAASPGT